MKKLLCFLGILVLLGLTALPPVLRIVMPDYGEEKEESIKKSYSILACSSEDFLVNTRYVNNKINILVFSRNIEKDITLETDNDELEENADQNENNNDTILEDNTINYDKLEKEFDNLFGRLKDSNNVTYDLQEDVEVISIDFSLSNHENLEISNYTKTINEQKNYYESLNLTCTIKEV